jgi:hypothetical protein
VLIAPNEVTWPIGSVEPARLTVSVRNVGTVETDYSLNIGGLSAAWCSLVPDRLRISGGESADALLAIKPPSHAKASNFSFSVRATVDGHPGIASSADGLLRVESPLPAAKPEPVHAPPPPAPAPTPVTAPAVPPAVSIAPKNTFKFAAGQYNATAILTIQNKSKLIERYKITVEDIPEEWYSLTTDDLKLNEGASQQVPVVLTPKPGPGYPAGEYNFRIRVAPHSFPDSFQLVDCTISLSGTLSFDASLVPAQAEGRKEKFKLTLVNTGAVPLRVWIQGTDPEGACKFRIPPAPDLDPGEKAVVPILVGARRNGLLGPAEPYAFLLKVTPAGGQSTQTRSFDAQLVHRPFLGTRFAGVALFLAALIAFVGIAIRIGPSSTSDAFNWVACQRDDDVQPARGGPVYVKESCGGAPSPTQDALNGRAAAVPDATTPESAVNGATPAPPAPCTPAASIAVGARVKSLPGDGVRIRSAPAESQVGVILRNETALVLEGHQCVDGLTWWRVRREGGNNAEGWAAEQSPEGERLLELVP